MSYRSSFVTEYIYCNTCFNACKEVLCENDKYLKGVVIPSWSDKEKHLPIIAGKIGSLSAGEEFFKMENIYIPKIQELMCNECKIRICVLGENEENIVYLFDKKNIKELKN